MLRSSHVSTDRSDYRNARATLFATVSVLRTDAAAWRQYIELCRSAFILDFDSGDQAGIWRQRFANGVDRWSGVHSELCTAQHAAGSAGGSLVAPSRAGARGDIVESRYCGEWRGSQCYAIGVVTRDGRRW